MRGQASVEYLMTYGWAIFALLLVLAALLTSGILSPNFLVSEECNLGTNLQCRFVSPIYNEGGSTTLALEVFNGFPYPIRIEEFQLETEDGTRSFSGFQSGAELLSGETEVFQGQLSGDPVPENTIGRFSANVTYRVCAPEL
ncbi:hypothetical protein GF318_05760, partial [Candidatus Micrarchaeota archaeon]|nr:hypothetical protein [Candidatus Micrarchaeota archaeon]